MGLFGLTDDEMAEVKAAFAVTPDTGQLLLEVARLKRDFNNASLERRDGAADLLILAAASLLADVLGEDALLCFYGDDPPPAASSREHLIALADRLFRLSSLFARIDGNAKSSLISAREELLAIAGGDQPRLFKAQMQVRGRPINAHRLAHHQLRALVWERFLRSNGNSVTDTHLAISTAYGAEWTTIARWETQVVRECQTAFKRDPRSASKRDPLFG